MSKPSPNNEDITTSKPHETNGSLTNDIASAASTQAEMAKAFQDLARGEQQAAALEASLTSLESKLDALLASIEGGPASYDTSRVEKSSEEQGPDVAK
ncbi:hypothetical protein F5Y11DRAFT_321876 [Daldinia sp. FL1419]|nr:hypothetical protein F5Y11DRAFT_321876 [Daldinia sp. FL1419]